VVLRTIVVLLDFRVLVVEMRVLVFLVAQLAAGFLLVVMMVLPRYVPHPRIDTFFI